MSDVDKQDEMQNPAPRRQKVQSAQVGTEILKGLATRGPSTSLSGLAEQVGMPASKVHRYLQALMASGFAVQDPITGHYSLGREALLVGMAAMRNLDVVRTVLPRLVELRDACNETCFLAVWGNQGPSVVQVEKPARVLTVVTQLGSVLPLLTSSTGLVFSAFLPEVETRDLIEAELAQPGAPSREALEQTLGAIRQTGLHSIHGLLMSGVNALSVPVFSLGHRLEGVITMVGTPSSFDADPEGRHAHTLMQVAESISFSLCGERPQGAGLGQNPPP